MIVAPPNELSILSLPPHRRGFLRKEYVWRDGKWVKQSDVPKSKLYVAATKPIADLAELCSALDELALEPRSCLVRGHPIIVGAPIARWSRPRVDAPATFVDVPRNWLCIDVDDFALRPGEALCSPDDVVRRYIRECLPPCFGGVACAYVPSASAGIKPGLRGHLFFLLSRPLTSLECKRLVPRALYPKVDQTVLGGVVQIIYTAAPLLTGNVDPLSTRASRLVSGAREFVPVPDELAEPPPWQPMPGSGIGDGHEGYPSIEAAQADLGDGMGGFHRPLLSITWRYAREQPATRRTYDEEAQLLATLAAAVRQAPRGARTASEIEAYVTKLPDYLRGADEKLAAVSALDFDVYAPCPNIEVIGLDEARARVEKALDEWLIAADKFEPIHFAVVEGDDVSEEAEADELDHAWDDWQ